MDNEETEPATETVDESSSETEDHIAEEPSESTEPIAEIAELKKTKSIEPSHIVELKEIEPIADITLIKKEELPAQDEDSDDIQSLLEKDRESIMGSRTLDSASILEKKLEKEKKALRASIIPASILNTEDKELKKRTMSFTIQAPNLPTSTTAHNTVEKHRASITASIASSTIVRASDASFVPFQRNSSTSQAASFTQKQISGDSINSSMDDVTVREMEHKIDLAHYHRIFLEYTERNRQARIKNNYLQSRMTQYLGKRQGAVPIAELFTDINTKYFQELIAYEHLRKHVTANEEKVNEEYRDLCQKKRDKVLLLDKLFKQMQQNVQDFTNNLSNDILSKHVERFIKKQKAQSNYITKLRLTHIKLKKHYEEKQQAYDDLDKLGPGYHIMDFVQLKFDNKNFRDKVEERDKELNKIRDSYKHFVQVLAHTREKIELVKKDIVECDGALETIETDYQQAREHLTYLRNERDELRKNINKMVDVLGMVGKPKLVEDITNSSREVIVLKKELAQLKKEYKQTNDRIVTLRAQMEVYKIRKYH